jgi:hypothetical protein
MAPPATFIVPYVCTRTVPPAVLQSATAPPSGFMAPPAALVAPLATLMVPRFNTVEELVPFSSTLNTVKESCFCDFADSCCTVSCLAT